MKTCSSCKQEKNFSEFNKSSKSKDGYQYNCIQCNRKKAKEHYQKNKDRYIERNKESAKRNIRYVCEYLKDKRCLDCGEDNPLTLQFDHVRNKKHNICDMLATGYSWESIQEEIDKCEIRCANCHQIKTLREKDSLKYRIFRAYGVNG